MKTKEYFTYEGITYEITKTEIIVNGECKNYTISYNPPMPYRINMIYSKRNQK